MAKNKVLYFITGNKNKLKEIQIALSPFKIKQLDVDLEEIQDLDPKKVLEHKISQALKFKNGGFIVEDAYAYFEFLQNKLPGPLIKWFNTSIGNKGIVELAHVTKKRNMTHKVVIAYVKSKNNVLFFKGELKGKIVNPKGKGGFGFDPIVLPNNSTQTLAELKQENYLSFTARGKAAKQLKEYLLKHEK